MCPGRSFFAILKDSAASARRSPDELGAGRRTREPGVLVPAAAAVISAGKFWCYVEAKPGTFVRTEIDPSRPTEEGYFVKEGISAGDKIVTAAAGQLLARVKQTPARNLNNHDAVTRCVVRAPLRRDHRVDSDGAGAGRLGGDAGAARCISRVCAFAG